MCIFILLLFPIKKRNITFKFLFQTFSEFFDRQTALLRSSTPEVPEEEPEVLHRCPNSSLIRVFSHLLEELHPESMVHPGLLSSKTSSILLLFLILEIHNFQIWVLDRLLQMEFPVLTNSKNLELQ